jgi:thiol-disulfide isomerase/thioredoxin
MRGFEEMNKRIVMKHASWFLASVLAAQVCSAAVKRPAFEPRYSGAQVGEWTMDHEAALAQAQAETNNVIVMFTGAWWCPHCQALENAVLTNPVWQAYVETNRIYLVMMDNPGRADQYWCWLRETNYVQNVAGLTLEQGEAEITNHYEIQTSYATPGAPTNTVKGVSYLRVGYPTLIGLRPDGSRLGRFTPLATTVSLDMALRNVRQILAADDWDEVDDYYQGATELAAPACENEETSAGSHTLSEADAADWFSFEAVAGTQWSFALRPSEAGITNGLKAQVLADPTNKVGLAERVMTPSELSVISFVAPKTARYWLKISRTLSLKELQGYRLAYWYGTSPADVLFAATEVTVPERSAAVTLTVNIANAAKDAEVRVSYETLAGSAQPGADYVTTVGELVWGPGYKSAKTITIPLIADAVWEGDEAFQVSLFPIKNCEVGDALSTCTVTLTEKSARVAGKLAFEGAGTAVLAEGSNALFSVARSAGANGVVSALVEHVQGALRRPVARLGWDNGELGSKAFAFSFTNEPGFQADRSSSLRLTALNGATLLSAAASSKALVRRDDLVLQTLAEYLADPAHAGFGLKAAHGLWFSGFWSDAERAEAWLRCGPVPAYASASLTGSAQGPGVLGYDWRAGGFGAALQCLLGAKVVAALSNDQAQAGAVLAVPAGRQSFSWTLHGLAGAAGAQAGVRNLAWYPLPQAAAPQPADKSAVINRALALQWQDVLAAAAFPAGVQTHYEIFAGTRAWQLSRLSEQSDARFPRLGNAADQTAFDALVAQAGALPIHWRIDAVATDAQGRRAVNAGTVWSVLVLPEGSPEFVASPGGYDPTPAAGVQLPQLTVGVRAAVGPFAIAHADGGTPRVSVKNGKLPSGMKAEILDGSVWVTGVPAQAGSGEGDVQVSLVRKVGGATTLSPGTTVKVLWTVAALGAAAGQFNGYLTVGDVSALGRASVSVTSAGRISGSLDRDGWTYAFSASQFDGEADGQFFAQGLAKSGARTMAVTFKVAKSGSGAEVTVDGDPSLYYILFRNNWGEPGGAALLGNYAGYYTVALPALAKSSENAPGGAGYLTLTVKANGAVTYAGALADGRSVSGSSVLLFGPDCCSSEDRATLYLLGKPTGYAAGSAFYGLLYFKPDGSGGAKGTTVEPAEPAFLHWINADPKSVFGYNPTTGALPDGISGFTNVLDATGGYYDTAVDLREVYGAQQLKILSGFAAPADFGGEQGTTGFALVSVPETDRVLATASGVSALAFPPTALTRNGALVDFAASSNPWSVALRPSSRTGVFTGSCLLYYQDGAATQQKTKSITLRGVFLPVRAPYQSHPDWLGFYLLPDATHYLDAGGLPKSYPFDWSHEFRLDPLDVLSGSSGYESVGVTWTAW